jgi:predicted transcriptional regulator
MSGFLAPEERAVLNSRRPAPSSEPAEDVAMAILQALRARGQLTVAALLPLVRARSRAVLGALGELETAQLVRVSTDGTDEVVELTEAGNRAIVSSPRS